MKKAPYLIGLTVALLAGLNVAVHNYGGATFFSLLVLLVGCLVIADAIRERK